MWGEREGEGGGGRETHTTGKDLLLSGRILLVDWLFSSSSSLSGKEVVICGSSSRSCWYGEDSQVA